MCSRAGHRDLPTGEAKIVAEGSKVEAFYSHKEAKDPKFFLGIDLHQQPQARGICSTATLFWVDYTELGLTSAKAWVME